MNVLDSKTAHLGHIFLSKGTSIILQQFQTKESEQTQKDGKQTQTQH